MDVGTSLVQAYLHVNGYFTATEYPLVEAARDHAPRTLTDIDLLAVRLARPAFARTNHDDGKSHVVGPHVTETDPALACPDSGADMIVAEIKQGRAQVNPGSRNRQVLAAALTRFGCCEAAEAPGLVKALLQHGRAQDSAGHAIRMVLFASRGERAPRGWHWVHLDHLFRFLEDFLLQQQRVLGSVDLRDPALAWLSLLRKCELTIRPERSST